MKHSLLRGKLTDWNDVRGFGFITPDDNTNDSVFIHISALKRMPRRPVVGDIIQYELEDNHGKVRAVHAFIEGISAPNQQYTRRNRSRKSNSVVDVVIAIVSFFLIMMMCLFVFVLVQSNRPSKTPPIFMLITKPDCVIKGNISISNGTHYYHLPGMEDYESTVISPNKGERWFCTEEEAISQGWRKAPR